MSIKTVIIKKRLEIQKSESKKRCGNILSKKTPRENIIFAFFFVSGDFDRVTTDSAQRATISLFIQCRRELNNDELFLVVGCLKNEQFYLLHFSFISFARRMRILQKNNEESGI